MRKEFLPYCRPDVHEDEIAAVAESMRNGWLTTGPKVREFEEAFAAASGVKHAIAVNSCTAALHIGLLAAGVQPGDEVITPSLTFVAGAQCTMEIGAIPVFCDVDLDTFTSDIEHFEAALTPKTKAIIAMPYGGRPMDIRRIVEWADSKGIAVIEDAAHAAGMLDRGEWAGTHSKLAAYSFYATKNLTTAEGGMLLTNDDAVMERVRVLSLHGMDRDAWKRYTAKGSWRYEVREPGFKYNMPDIAAAMGIVQMRRLESMQARRDELARRFTQALAGVPGITCQAAPTNEGDRHSWCMYVIRIDEQQAGVDRDTLIERMKEQNIGTSVHYIPTHLFQAYRHLDASRLENTQKLWCEIISLPLFPSMSDQDASDVINAVLTGINRSNQASVMLAS
ncbi:MAG TPA: DegT/DnrJ/EryC1/StrS family aminotransferase [Candidatus Baltobacteraceae bacterium]|nr:DegT/DnrJ/EryC1/StrS family aminotransferase [Candidatus Baltobacteraceae bacterium]